MALATPHASWIFSFDPIKRAVSLATSIDEPPPNPITPVALKSDPTSTHFINVFIEGSASTLSKTNTSECDFNADKVSSIKPNLTNPGSVTKSIFFPSFLVTSSAVFLDSCTPKRMPGVVLNWKDFTAVI